MYMTDQPEADQEVAAFLTPRGRDGAMTYGHALSREAA